MAQNVFAGVRWVWMNGKLVEFEKATIHVMTHALHYGSGFFEGIRCYATPEGPAVFRLPEHIRRLEHSCKIYRTTIPFTAAEIEQAILETIDANGLGACYIRPIVYRGFGHMGVNPLPAPVEVAIGVWPWGKYLGPEAQEQGVAVCVSSWRRGGPGVYPALAKATANYLTSQLVRMEAMADGYHEGITLDSDGYLSEGSGENVFVVQEGVILTPPLSAALLPGITRGSVITLARDLGYEVREMMIPRGMLYTCDEMFFTGTAVEVAPIVSVDKIPVGSGRPGEVTRRLMAEYLGIVEGRIPDRHGWLTQVGVGAAKAASPA